LHTVLEVTVGSTVENLLYRRRQSVTTFPHTRLLVVVGATLW
jgi:hypothetical protein